MARPKVGIRGHLDCPFSILPALRALINFEFRNSLKPRVWATALGIFDSVQLVSSRPLRKFLCALEVKVFCFDWQKQNLNREDRQEGPQRTQGKIN